MMAYITKKEEKKAKKSASAKQAPSKTSGSPVATKGGKAGKDKSGDGMTDTRPEDDRWSIDDKLVIDSHDDDQNSMHLDKLADKLTMFGRLDGLEAIFLVDNHGQLFKSINKSGLDENVIPSMVFNLSKASVMGMRRVGYGSFQRGSLTTPFGTIILVNVFYAILALVIDHDGNLGPVESRIQRYLSEVME